MTRPMVLRWLERALFAGGIVLGVWSVATLVEASFVAGLPVPPTQHKTPSTLPGDASSRATPSRVTPRRGVIVAHLEAPTVHLSATVLEGTDDGTLGRGAGHIEGTPFPGQPGNIGIAGHRDTTFRAVRNLKLGDPLDIVTSERVYRYFISKTSIVKPDDVYVLDPGPQSMLTLVTCYPFEFIGHAPRRYIIQATLFDQAPRKATVSHDEAAKPPSVVSSVSTGK